MWLTEAFNSLTVDEAARMRALGSALSLLRGHVPSSLTMALAAGASAAPAAPSTSSTPVRISDDATQPLPARKLAALDELQEFVEDIDNAKNLFAIGAFPALMQCVLGEAPPPAEGVAGATIATNDDYDDFAPPAVQARAAEVLSTVLQNNPAAQSWALQSGALHALSTALARAAVRTHVILQSAATGVASSADELTAQLVLQAGLVSALSALVRHNGAAQAALMAGLDLSASGSGGSGNGAGFAMEVDLGGGATAHVSPFSLLVLPISLWPQLHTPGLPAGARSRGRRLVRKCLLALRHLVEAGVDPDAVKAACLRARLDAPAPGPTAVAAAATSGTIPALLRLLHRATDGASVDDDDDDADARDARESALYVFSALLEPSVAGASVKDDSEKRRLGADGRPAAVPRRGGGTAVPEATLHLQPLPSAPAPAVSQSPYVASVPTAAATMIAARRAAAAQAGNVAASSAAAREAARREWQFGDEAPASNDSAPVIAGLLMPPPGPSATRTEHARTNNATTHSRVPANVHTQLPPLSPPRLGLTDRLAALREPALGVRPALAAAANDLAHRAAVARARARAGDVADSCADEAADCDALRAVALRVVAALEATA